jgi:hypothetical protein
MARLHPFAEVEEKLPAYEFVGNFNSRGGAHRQGTANQTLRADRFGDAGLPSCMPVSKSMGRTQPGTAVQPLAVHVEKTMNRWKATVTCLSLYCVLARLSGQSHCQCTVDATRQPVSATRGMGPTPGSDLPGHSARFPVRLDLLLGTGKLEADGTQLIDFVLTNIGGKPIKLPASIDWNMPKTHVLTLYLTVGRESFPVDHLTSAELFGGSGNSQTFCLLAPGKTMRVHASTRFRLTPGIHLFTAHAELVKSVGGASDFPETADSISVHKVFTAHAPAAR